MLNVKEIRAWKRRVQEHLKGLIGNVLIKLPPRKNPLEIRKIAIVQFFVIFLSYWVKSWRKLHAKLNYMQLAVFTQKIVTSNDLHVFISPFILTFTFFSLEFNHSHFHDWASCGQIAHTSVELPLISYH